MYEIFAQILEEKGLKAADVSRGTGIKSPVFSEWKKGKSNPNAEKLLKISNFLEVSMEYLLTGKEKEEIIQTCPDCGMTYDSSCDQDIKQHTQEHLLWMKASEKFGELYCNYLENEKIKARGRNICHDKSLPLSERYAAQLQVLRCLFSRSIQANNYNLKHVMFEKYVAMMLGNKSYVKLLDDDLYKKLKANFGTLPGIVNGTKYYVPDESCIQTLAAHFDGDEYTEEEWEEIMNFAEYVKNKRK